MSDDPQDDDYVAPWRKDSVLLSNGELPTLNGHLTQVKPRTNKRPAVIDERIQAAKNKPRERPSGHSLMR